MEHAPNRYIKLNDLEVYKLSRNLSRQAWTIYQNLDWKQQKVIGDQFITSTDSVGANIAEGYARFHFLDKIKFYYHSRGSLMEAAEHWLPLLLERKLITTTQYSEYSKTATELSIKLQHFINSTARAKYNKSLDSLSVS